MWPPRTGLAFAAHVPRVRVHVGRDVLSEAVERVHHWFLSFRISESSEALKSLKRGVIGDAGGWRRWSHHGSEIEAKLASVETANSWAGRLARRKCMMVTALNPKLALYDARRRSGVEELESVQKPPARQERLLLETGTVWRDAVLIRQGP